MKIKIQGKFLSFNQKNEGKACRFEIINKTYLEFQRMITESTPVQVRSILNIEV